MSSQLAYDAAMADEELTEAISLRITREDRAALDSLAARYPLKGLTIARIALRLGLAEIQRNPNALFFGPHLKGAEETELESDLATVQRDMAAGRDVPLARKARAVLTKLNKAKK